MIAAIIRWSVYNRLLVLMLTAVLVGIGIYSVKNTSVDAIPDLSDVQVIVKTSYPGQAPQVVENQVTYPLTTAMLSVPGAKTVRGFSFFGDSYVYVIFSEDVDVYWARSRVLEYLSQVAPSLPTNATPQLGPDATGVGWVYLYALQDTTGQHDLSQLRSFQDWLLKFELQTVAGVSEVATIGGMEKQYQVIVDPTKLRAYNIPLAHIRTAIQQANQEVGASVIEMAEAEYMVRASGYIQELDDLRHIPLGISAQGTTLTLADVADIRLGPAMRRGVAELNGNGEVVGGVVVMRYGDNAQATINRVKDKLAQLQSSLPDGVEVVTVYDRSQLIEAAVDNLWQTLWQELLLVALVCVVFLFHLRSSLVAVISLPIGILAAFIVMHWQGLNANIMSLGGIAIAIGAMIDGAIVFIDNMHRHVQMAQDREDTITAEKRWQLVITSATEVGPALFFSLLIITVSFVPVFALEAQEGRLFSPLAYTKTYAMAASAALAVTLVPVLLGYFVRGRIPAENRNPVNRALLAVYRPLLRGCLRFPKTVVVVALVFAASSWWPLQHIGSEFMPPLDEGDLMYMPTTYPGISIGKARQLLQQTDKLIATIPEVKTVFGKVGRAETATDPAPLTMIETFIQLKPKSQWRESITSDDIKRELEQTVQLPGVSNAWVMPIKTRIDMLATGIKTPVGIRIAGPELDTIQEIGATVETQLQSLPGTVSVYSERVASGRYIDIDINRQMAARFGLSVNDIQTVIASAIGGQVIGETVEGLERYSINVRYPQRYRDSPEQLQTLPIVTADGQHIPLGDVATINVVSGPAVIKSENARINGWVFIEIDNIDVGEYVAAAQQHLTDHVSLPAGYTLIWAGQYEYMQRAENTMKVIVPLTLGIIVILLFLNFRQLAPVILLLLSLPLALVGSFWLMYWMGFNFSVAVAVGLIALAGVAVETGVIMLVYLQQTGFNQLAAQVTQTAQLNNAEARVQLQEQILQAAVKRVRPVLMTATATIVGLLPILVGDGVGSEVMSRLAAPMVGGMVSAVLLTLFVLPVIFYSWKANILKRQEGSQ